MTTQSEYTPTTDDARVAYATEVDEIGRDYRDPQHEAAFDRWLAQYTAAKRAEWEAVQAPEKDERLVRFMAMSTVMGVPTARAVVESMRLLIQAETQARLAEQVEHHGRREFTAAYTSQSGVVCPFGFPTVVQADAQAVADEFSREDPDGPNYFVATRILPPWLPVTNTESEGKA